MKKLLFVCVMLLCLHSVAFATPNAPLLSLNIDTVFPALDKASKDTDFLFDASGAEKSCGEAACTAKLKVDTGSQILVTYNESSQKVEGIIWFLQMAYKNDEAIANAMLRGVNALRVMGRLINPKITDADLKKLNKRVGILAEGLVKGEGKHEATYKGVHLSAAYVSGAYILSVSSGEEKTNTSKKSPAAKPQVQKPSWSPKIDTSLLNEVEETLTWDEMLAKEASKK